MIKVSKRLRRTNANNQHFPSKDCSCSSCSKDRTKGCANPQKCAQTANTILHRIAPKFNTKTKPKKDGLSLTHRRREKNQQAHERRQGEILFDPSTTVRSCLSDCFRIFTDPNCNSLTPAHRLHSQARGLNLLNEKLTIYTDGSFLENGKHDARCGSGIWIAEDHPQNRAIRIPGEKQSNQIAELSAILVALQNTDPYVPITFMTDSKYAIDGLTKNLTRWEDDGWIDIANSEHIRATAYHLRKRSAQTSFVWVKGNSGQIGNERADQLEREGAKKQNADHIDLSIPNEFNLQGARLSAITQSLAYKAIRKQKKPTQRRQTTINLEVTRHAIQELTGHSENDTNIWNGCRNKDLNKKMRQFLFKAMHGAYRIGDYWLNIPTYEQRARCAHCNTDTESMEHILLECSNNARTIIWPLAKETWPESFGAWPQINIGTILGCGNISTSTDTGKR